ncbi:MAG: 50S ribosomal protein L28 [Bacteroidota bacterium]|nr:50S ribosomal protein L28 [Bacteroidota bacterium]MDP4232264.1 50S ribosomal protein L28 [Bacteroidota bacterium]MDP4242666.1 50S ribosomal protein L28 [Bacteroidota bacterium]MDP4286772.1 50S ribosomal protein L28 [Bacteroidota bacterium]
MARVCELTGVKPVSGNHVSHAVNRSKKRILPNLQTKRVWDAETGKFVTIKATARAFRTLDKKGLRAMRAKV